MGAAQGKRCPSHLPPGLGGRDLRERSRLKPGNSARRLLYAGWPPWAARALRSARRSSCRHPSSPHWRLTKVAPKCLSGVLRILRSFLGDLHVTSIVGMPGVLHKMLPSAAHSAHSSSPDHHRLSRQTPGVAQEQEVTAHHLAAPWLSQDPCPGKTVLPAPGDSDRVLAEQREDPGHVEHPRGSPQVAGGAQSAFRPLVAHSHLPSFVPRPGALQRNLRTQSSPDRAEISRASWVSCCPQRNAISSSYSSTRGLPAPKRRAPGSGHSGLPLGGSSSPGIPRKRALHEKVAEGRAGQPLRRNECPPTGRPRKRRFPLLPRRRGEPLRLPPPLELAWPLTAEDLDREKEKAWQQIKRLLMGETQGTRDSCRMPPQAHGWAPSAWGGARPLASVGLSQTLPHHSSSATMVASTPMSVGSAVSSQRHPHASTLSGPFLPSLPTAASALPFRPSPSTLAGSALQPVAPFGSTLMSTNLGPPSTSARSFLPSPQGPMPNRAHRASPVDSSGRPVRRLRQHAPPGKQTPIPGASIPPIPGVPVGKKPRAPSFDSCQMFGRPGAPGPGAAPFPPLTAGPPNLSSPNHTNLGDDKNRDATLGARASTHTHSSGGQAARPTGTSRASASASVVATQRPGPVTRLCPKNRQPQSTWDNKVSSPLKLPVSVTSTATGRTDISPGPTSHGDITSICSKRREAPQTREHRRASSGENTNSAPSHNTTMAPKKHAKKCKQGQGITGVPALSAIPQSLPTQEALSSSQGTSATTTMATFISSVPVISMGSGSPDVLPDLIAAFGALCISSPRGGTPSNRQQPGAGLGHNTSSAPRQSTTMGSQGHKANCKPGQATSGVPAVPAIPQSLPMRKHSSSPGGSSTTPRKTTSPPKSVPGPSMGPGSPDLLPDLCSAFGAMSISSHSGGARSVRLC